jgi:hypothetical protein
MITVDKLYQWDLNRTVTVNDAADEMHWQQPYSSTALRTSIVDGKANIPNIVLQQHGKIKCWSYDSANGRTVNVYEIDISRRQKPDNYVYTETEVITVEQYVNDYLASGQVQVSWNNITDKPSAFTPSSHNHDDIYYTMTDVNLLLGGLASADHNHDSSYYTKTSANNLFQSKPTYVKDTSTTVISVTPNDNTEYVFTQTASAVEVILPTMTEGFHCAISWHNGTTSFTLNEGDYTVAMLVNGEVTNTYTPEASKIVLMTIHYNGDYVLITINEF